MDRETYRDTTILLRGIRAEVPALRTRFPNIIVAHQAIDAALVARDDTGLTQARQQAARTAAFLWDKAQGNPEARESCRRFGINPDLPLLPQVQP